MLELWGRANAYNVLKPLWMLRELGLDFNHHDLGSRPGDLDSDAFRALNPHGRIPVLSVGDQALCESNSIVRYLAASHGGERWWPRDALARARAERWMDWELASLQPDFIDLFWRFYRTPVAAREHELIGAAQRRCRLRMRQLDAALTQRDYLAGEEIGIADISCGVCLYRYFEMGIEVERPAALMRWYRRLARRPAYRDTVMLDFGELAGRLEF